MIAEQIHFWYSDATVSCYHFWYAVEIVSRCSRVHVSWLSLSNNQLVVQELPEN